MSQNRTRISTQGLLASRHKLSPFQHQPLTLSKLHPLIRASLCSHILHPDSSWSPPEYSCDLIHPLQGPCLLSPIHYTTLVLLLPLTPHLCFPGFPLLYPTTACTRPELVSPIDLVFQILQGAELEVK